MNPKEEAIKIADILNKEKQEKKVAWQERAVQQRLEEDNIEKRRQKMKEDFYDTGIEVLFKELVSQKVVSNARVSSPTIFADRNNASAVITLGFNFSGDSYDFDEDRIHAIYNSDGLVIRGKGKFHVGINCSLTEAILTALKNPEHEYRRSNL